MKKIYIILALLVVIVGLLYVLRIGSPSKDLPSIEVNKTSNQSTSKDEQFNVSPEVVKVLNNLDLKITGYGPGKSHEGTFTKYSVSDVKMSQEKILQSAKVVIDSNSREFKIDGLNKHLCAPEFLDCSKYPTIQFSLKSVSTSSQNKYVAYGDLTFRGITKPVSFPVEKSGDKYSTSVRFDISQFGINYVGVNNEILINLSTR